MQIELVLLDVIVNALRKLESAGVIESRSLGMKGTFIKVKKEKFLDELEKVSKSMSLGHNSMS